MSDERLEFGEVAERIAELAERLVGRNPEVGELLDWIDAFHREGLGRLIEMARQWRGEIFLDSLANDPVVGMLLDAYGLGVGADMVEARRSVQAALAEVRPYFHSHGGDMEVASITDGVVIVTMHGSCDGCTAASVTLATEVDSALRRHWGDFRRVEFVESDAAPHPAPIAGQVTIGLQIGRSRCQDWTSIREHRRSTARRWANRRWPRTWRSGRGPWPRRIP